MRSALYLHWRSGIMLTFIGVWAVVGSILALTLHPVTWLVFGADASEPVPFFDLIGMVALPVIIAIGFYVRAHDRHEDGHRRRFLTAFADQELVISRFDRGLIYQVVKRHEDTGHLDLKLIWKVNREVPYGRTYPDVAPQAVEPLNRERFLDHWGLD